MQKCPSPENPFSPLNHQVVPAPPTPLKIKSQELIFFFLSISTDASPFLGNWSQNHFEDSVVEGGKGALGKWKEFSDAHTCNVHGGDLSNVVQF